MITYGKSIQGKSHIEKGTVCQDYSKHGRIESGHYIGIVADGVGSAKHSDIGSKCAVESLFNYCNRNIEKSSSSDQIYMVLLEGYHYALDEIKRYVEENAANINDYDTTLSAVIYDGNEVVFGHAGDGGIIVRNKNGEMYPITKRQKGADGISVRPLRAGDQSWEFGTEDDVLSVLLVTDGMLDGVIQPSLVNLPETRMEMVTGRFNNNNVYVTATEFFMNPYSVFLNRQFSEPEKYIEYLLKGNIDGDDQEQFKMCILNAYEKLLGKENAFGIVKGIERYYYFLWALKNVTDDKSLVCIINDKETVSPQSPEYYREPDWKNRQERYDALLYGGSMPVEISNDENSNNNTLNVQRDNEESTFVRTTYIDPAHRQTSYQRPSQERPVNGKPANGKLANGKPANGRPANGRPTNKRPASRRTSYEEISFEEPFYEVQNSNHYKDRGFFRMLFFSRKRVVLVCGIMCICLLCMMKFSSNRKQDNKESNNENVEDVNKPKATINTKETQKATVTKPTKETIVPQVTEKPIESKEPEETTEPQATEKPIESKEPEETTEPQVTEEPIESKEPEGTTETQETEESTEKQESDENTATKEPPKHIIFMPKNEEIIRTNIKR